MLASNTLASVNISQSQPSSYTYVTEHGSAHIKKTALQRVYATIQQLQELRRPADPQQRLLYVPSPQPTLPVTASTHRSDGQPSRNHRAAEKKTPSYRKEARHAG
jgi:hypothetical protein